MEGGNQPRRHRGNGSISYNAPVEQPTVSMPRTSGGSVGQQTNRIRPQGNRAAGEGYSYGETRQAPSSAQPMTEQQVYARVAPRPQPTRPASYGAPGGEGAVPPPRRPVTGAPRSEQPAARPTRPAPGPRPTAAERKPRRRSRKGVVFSVILFAVILAVVTVISPWQPLHRATTTVSNPDGSVTVIHTGIDYSGLHISEVMTSNRSAVPDENGSYPDWVEIWNSTDADINLKGVGLSDRADSIRFLFPDVTLTAGGRTVVFCDDSNSTDAVFHAKFKLSSVGETVYLYTPDAYEIDHVKLPLMAKNESWALIDGVWQSTPWYSPGYENGEEGNTAYLLSTQVKNGELVINEIAPDVKTDLIGQGLTYDWIELYNTTDRTIRLDNYALSDKGNKPLQWRFPEGASIAPGGYYLVYCSGLDQREDPTAIPHTNFRLSAEHDTVILSDVRGNLVDRVIVDNVPEDCTWGRQ